MIGVTDPASIPARHSPIRRVAVVAINLLLVAVIIGLLVATWLPAILDTNPTRFNPAWRGRGMPLE
jgi:hypothetical protein